MKFLKVISVCGSGTVTSSMVAMKVKDLLEEMKISASTTEVNPSGVDALITEGSYDFIVHTSPLVRKYDIPTINAVGLLTGIGEDECLEEIKKTAGELAGK